MEGTMKLTNAQHEEALRAIRNGASVHQIAAKYKLSIDESNELIAAVARETREGASSHRIMLRALLREQAPLALKTLVDLCQPNLNVENQMDLQVLNLRLKAAEKILGYASRMMIEDVVTGMVEAGKEEQMQETLFDFESVVNADGGTTLVAQPKLKLVENS